MNHTSDLTRRLWAALLALCLTLSLALPVFAEGESESEPETKEMSASITRWVIPS